MRVFTSFFTSPAGSGLSAGNRIVPLAGSYPASSFSCALMGVSTGIEGAMVLRSAERTGGLSLMARFVLPPIKARFAMSSASRAE